MASYPLSAGSEFRFEYPEFFSERLVFRKMIRTDRQAIFSYCSDPDTARLMMWNRHESLQDTDGFLDAVFDDYLKGKPTSWGLALKENPSRMIGSIGYHNFDPKHQRIEIGYVIAPEFWGKGLMTEALRALTDYTFEHIPVVRIQIQCVTDNLASAKVMEKAGYRYEGTFEQYLYFKKRFWDAKQYVLLKRDWEIMNE